MAPTGKNARKRLPDEKQPKASVARYLKSTEPQIHEGAKVALLLKGKRCSETMGHVLKDLRAMQAPNAKLLTKKNDINVFDDSTSMEFLCTKNDASTFALASHNKKRPDNLVFGRIFDDQMLDAIEIGVTNYKGLNFFQGAPKKRVGSKPMFLFVGDKWSTGEHKRLQNLVLDWFRGDPVDSLAVSGLDHVIVLTSMDDKVYFRTYYVKLKKDPSGSSKCPLPILTNAGPHMDWTLRRNHFATPDIWKDSLRQPRQLVKKKVKNKSTNLFGETIGRLHLDRQDVDSYSGKRTKVIRIAEQNAKREEEEAIENDLANEREADMEEFRSDFGFEEGGDGTAGDAPRGGGSARKKKRSSR